MRKCGARREPYVDYEKAVKFSAMVEGTLVITFAESDRYFYAPGGLKRIKKAGTNRDKAIRRVLGDVSSPAQREDRIIQMKNWNLL